MKKNGKITQEEAKKEEERLITVQSGDEDCTLAGLIALFASRDQDHRLIIFGPSRVEGEIRGDREGVVLEGLAAIDPDRVNAVLKRLYPEGVPIGEEIFEYVLW
jgi:hypothetical protein